MSMIKVIIIVSPSQEKSVFEAKVKIESLNGNACWVIITPLFRALLEEWKFKSLQKLI